MENRNKKYWAFISYSHHDRKWGKWLHKKLETYQVPETLIGTEGRNGPVPRRLFPVFRDRDELSSSTDLGKNIKIALSQSRYLIVICSPRSARSHWVNQEVKTFKELGNENQVLCLIIDGESYASDKPDLYLEECFPDAIKYRVSTGGEITNQRIDPVAADLRNNKDGKSNALLKLISGMLGVDYDALKQRDHARKIKRQRIILIASVILLSIFSYLGLGYYQADTKLRQSFIQSRIDKARTCGQTMKEGILSDDLLGIASLAFSLRTKPVKYVVILNDQGKILTQSGDLSETALEKIELITSDEVKNTIQEEYSLKGEDLPESIVIEPITFQNLLVGYCILGF